MGLALFGAFVGLIAQAVCAPGSWSQASFILVAGGSLITMYWLLYPTRRPDRWAWSVSAYVARDDDGKRPYVRLRFHLDETRSREKANHIETLDILVEPSVYRYLVEEVKYAQGRLGHRA